MIIWLISHVERFTRVSFFSPIVDIQSKSSIHEIPRILGDCHIFCHTSTGNPTKKISMPY